MDVVNFYIIKFYYFWNVKEMREISQKEKCKEKCKEMRGTEGVYIYLCPQKVRVIIFFA